jgi:hypothetical protein
MLPCVEFVSLQGVEYLESLFEFKDDVVELVVTIKQKSLLSPHPGWHSVVAQTCSFIFLEGAHCLHLCQMVVFRIKVRPSIIDDLRDKARI